MRRVRPQTSYDDHERYPSVIDTALSRRSFLRGGLTASAAVGGLVMLGGAESTAGGRRPKTHRTALKLTQRYRFRYGNYEVQRIMVQTGSGRLVRFLGDKQETAGIEKSVRKVLDAHTCADLRNGKSLARLQRRVAKALSDRFRKRQGRGVPEPTVILFVGVPGDRCKGDCAAPVPICKPPTTKRPRKRPRK